jgi:vancomycin permeability regulator SanA
MLKKIFQIITKLTLGIVSVGVLAITLPRLITAIHSSARIESVVEVAPKSVTIVFGAGLTRDGRPTRVLRDRVETAAELYFQGKTQILLMSGDNRFEDYNEPQAMKDYAVRLGVPAEAIVLDYAGQRTYDTCYRALHIFQVDHAILVTQQFHLPRALYTCAQLGINAVGVVAENHYFLKRSRTYWNLRELLATPVAFWELHISQPLPILGNPEPIFGTRISGDEI